MRQRDREKAKEHAPISSGRGGAGGREYQADSLLSADLDVGLTPGPWDSDLSQKQKARDSANEATQTSQSTNISNLI